MILFRSIRNPFQRGFSTKVVTIVTTLIYILALLLNFHYFYYKSYDPYPGKADGWLCWHNSSNYVIFASVILEALMINFIPFLIIVTLHILSYRAITKSTERFHLDINRLRIMKKVRNTFFIVTIVFFLLTCPSVIYFITMVCIWLLYPHMEPTGTLIFDIEHFLALLTSFNSCANPFFCSKLHRIFAKCLR